MQSSSKSQTQEGQNQEPFLSKRRSENQDYQNSTLHFLPKLWSHQSPHPNISSTPFIINHVLKNQISPSKIVFKLYKMGLLTKTFTIFFIFLIIFANLELRCESKSAPDYNTLVYKGCAKQSLSDPTGIYSQAISALFGTLVSQSSKTRFYKTTTGSSQTTITGLFQCRGDLSNMDCYNCVSRLPILTDKLCGKPVAARIQLLGCYMLYEVAGFTQISGLELLYKTCGGTNVAGSGFEERRDTAFSTLESGVTSGNGFYTTSYESMYVLGQCQGDLGSSDCGGCVKTAVQRAQVECGASSSGQIYLHKCFISYSYYPNGVPKKSSPSSSTTPYSPSSSSSEQNTGKTVAIILGGAAGVGFLVICLLFARSLLKKHDDY